MKKQKKETNKIQPKIFYGTLSYEFLGITFELPILKIKEDEPLYIEVDLHKKKRNKEKNKPLF